MNIEEQLYDLHQNFGYVISVVKNEELNSLQVEFPGSVIGENQYDGTIITYTLDKDGIVKETDDPAVSPSNFSADHAIVRPIIAADIICECIKQEMNSSLLTKFIGGEKVDNELVDMLDAPLPEFIKREKALRTILDKLLKGVDCAKFAKDHEVSDDFAVLINVFEMGGI